MKYPFLTLVLPLWLACTPDQQQAGETLDSTASFAASRDQDTAKYVPLYIHDIPAEEDLNASPVATGGFGQILVPDMSRYQTQLLVKSYWVCDGYADNNGSGWQRLAGIGQWFKFNTNGTFSGGHWGRQTHAGAYYLDFQGEHPRITIDSNVDRLDAVWEMQAINGPQDAMAWVRVGNSGFGPKLRETVQAKWISLDDRPTKQQFARQLGI